MSFASAGIWLGGVLRDCARLRAQSPRGILGWFLPLGVGLPGGAPTIHSPLPGLGPPLHSGRPVQGTLWFGCGVGWVGMPLGLPG